jgi:hypothetical protein
METLGQKMGQQQKTSRFVGGKIKLSRVAKMQTQRFATWIGVRFPQQLILSAALNASCPFWGPVCW